jgi:cation transport ATPase
VIVDAETEQRITKTKRVTLPIHGLAYGGGGALTAERALARVPGVQRAYVNPLTEMAYVEYDPAITQPAQLTAVVEGVGLRVGEPGLR